MDILEIIQEILFIMIYSNDSHDTEAIDSVILKYNSNLEENIKKLLMIFTRRSNVLLQEMFSRIEIVPDLQI